MRKKLSYHKLS